MSLSLKETNAIQALAVAVCDLLPGGGSPQWRGHVSFGTVARDAGVADFWAATGSKVPRLAHLFERTLEHRRASFEPLMLGIVKAGLLYRRKKGSGLTTRDIATINGHILEIGFRFPALWDATFISALAVDDTARAHANVRAAQEQHDTRASTNSQYRNTLAALKADLESLAIEPDRQRAGFALEKLLNRLFALVDLPRRQAFRVTGEQIDGSFVLDDEVYLLEAKWEAKPLPEADLLVFRGKIEGKSAFTRGVFLAMHGISKDAQGAIRIGKQPTFFIISGHDLMMIVQGAMRLDDFLRTRYWLLAEEGAVWVPFERTARRFDDSRT